MNIGIFTDTFIRKLAVLEHRLQRFEISLSVWGTLFIFLRQPTLKSKKIYERNTFRFTSIPFVSFTDRRIAVRGLFQAYEVAKELNLDIIHTQTEFSMGLIGKFVAKNLKSLVFIRTIQCMKITFIT